MKQNQNEWKLSIRDGGNRIIENYPTEKFTKEKKEKLKQEIVEHHETLGLPKNLKKEMYPELF